MTPSPPFFAFLFSILQEKQRDIKELFLKLEETEHSLKETEDKFV